MALLVIIKSDEEKNEICKACTSINNFTRWAEGGNWKFRRRSGDSSWMSFELLV